MALSVVCVVSTITEIGWSFRNS